MTAIDDKKLNELLDLVNQIREAKGGLSFVTYEQVSAPRYDDGRLMWPIKLDMAGAGMSGYATVKERLTEKFNAHYVQWIDEIKAELEAELEQLAEAVTKVLL